MSRKRSQYKNKITTVDQAREIARNWLKSIECAKRSDFGLPEIDDRRNIWRVPVISKTGLQAEEAYIGEIVIDAFSGKITGHTDTDILKKRLQAKDFERSPENRAGQKKWSNGRQAPPPYIPNKVLCGDATTCLEELPPDSIQLIFTSPPYYNAKPQCIEYLDYQEYLDSLRKVFLRCHDVLSEGRFILVNASPVLVRRVNRQSSSRRIPVPFDLHHILSSIGFDFIDDIIWVKPEGAGWATGRGRRFAADRNPLQYKPVPVTEYILVYRKRTRRLIDWNIRTHHDPELVKASKIEGDYDVTNVWYIPPAHHKKHPAVFPDSLVEKVIKYYSFADDCVLDPFAGVGTVGRVAMKLGRRFFLIERDDEYFKTMVEELLPCAKEYSVEIFFEPENGGLYASTERQLALFEWTREKELQYVPKTGKRRRPRKK